MRVQYWVSWWSIISILLTKLLTNSHCIIIILRPRWYSPFMWISWNSTFFYLLVYVVVTMMWILFELLTQNLCTTNTIDAWVLIRGVQCHTIYYPTIRYIVTYYMPNYTRGLNRYMNTTPPLMEITFPFL